MPCGSHKTSPVYHHNGDKFSGPFGIMKFIFSDFENRVLHKPVLCVCMCVCVWGGGGGSA